MNWLQEQLRNTSPPDLLLHLGAGTCQELDHWLKTGARRIVLVEPNPELLPGLRDRTENHDAVEIVAVAISGQAGRGALRLFNFALLSSMREPTGLYEILPGLRQIGRAMVETVTVEQLLDDLDLNPEGDHWLVIDTPGEEAAIIQQLETSERLHQFSRIILTAGAEELYQGAETARALIERLQSAGYKPVGRPNDRDGDWPCYHLALNRLALEYRQAVESLEQAEAAARTEADRAQALATDCEQLRHKLAEAEQARAQAEEKHKAQLVQTRQLESALTEQKSTNEKLGIELHERKKDLARFTQAHDEAQQKLTEAQQKDAQRCERINQLEAALAEKTKQAEELQTTLQSHQQELATAKDQRAKLTEQVEALKPFETQQKQTQQKLEQVTQSRDNLQKQLQKHSEEAHKLKIRVSQLEEENEDYQERHKLLEEELIKAEAQIELIKQLFLSGDDALDFDDNEPEKG